MTDRMILATEAMKALLAKDFKNIGFSAYGKATSPADYIADQSFTLADAMIARESRKDIPDDQE